MGPEGDGPSLGEGAEPPSFLSPGGAPRLVPFSLSARGPHGVRKAGQGARMQLEMARHFRIWGDMLEM